MIARTNPWAMARFFWIHLSEANQLAIKKRGSTSPRDWPTRGPPAARRHRGERLLHADSVDFAGDQ